MRKGSFKAGSRAQFKAGQTVSRNLARIEAERKKTQKALTSGEPERIVTVTKEQEDGKSTTR